MNVTINAVNTALSTNEFENLRQQAEDRVGMPQAMREWLNNNLVNLPALTSDTHTSEQEDERGNVFTKEQSVSDILWTISFITLAEGSLSRAGLETLFKDEGGLDLEYAGDVLKAMRGVYVEQEPRIENTKDGKVIKFYDITASFKKQLEDIILELRAKTIYQRNVIFGDITPWHVDENGNVKGIHDSANLPFSKLNQRSQPVLNASNRLMTVEYLVDNDMVQELRDIAQAPKDLEQKRECLAMLAIHKRDQPFKFVVKADGRGRLSLLGGVVSPQGSKECKAALSFAQSKQLTERGAYALAVYTASEWGQKGSKDKLAMWTHQNMDMLCNVEDGEDCPSILAYRCAIEVKRTQLKPDAWSNLPVHIDGTCNGVQHMAAMMREPSSAKAVNLLPSTEADEPQDLYGLCHEDRDLAKEPVMTKGYGAGFRTISNNIGSEELAKQILDQLDVVAPSITWVVDILKGAAQEGMATSFKWTTPDGFVVKQAYADLEPITVRAGNFSAQKKGAEIFTDVVKMECALAPNFVHSIDATHLRMTVNALPEGIDISPIHDSLGTHACDVDTVSRVLREQFVNIYSKDVLNKFLAEVGFPQVNLKRFAKRKDYTPFDINEVINSAYFFS